MQFFHEGDAPPVPQGEESPEIAAATAAVVAVESVIATNIPIPGGGSPSSSCPSSGGALQHQGGADGSTSTSVSISMSSPPPVGKATEERTLVVYPPECLLHM